MTLMVKVKQSQNPLSGAQTGVGSDIEVIVSTTISRLKSIWAWLGEAQFFWLATAVIIMAMAISLRPHSPEPLIRLTGLVLQLLGIGTVIWGISETRAMFGHPSIASKATAWLRRFPLFRRNTVIAVDGVTCTATCGTARAYGTHGVGPNLTLESLAEALEKNVMSIHERITQTQNEMDGGFGKAAVALQNEAQHRATEDNLIREKLEATGTGGVHISAIGAAWLFVGVILSTASVEIAKVLK